jgi:Dyp-type peroxidase family
MQNPSDPQQPQSSNHFGFIDGISQPTLQPASAVRTFWKDEVKKGDLFLGYENSRGDDPGSPQPFLDDGSFLVVRRLRQHADRLDRAVDAAARRLAPGNVGQQQALRELFRAKMLGRQSNGSHLLGGRDPAGNDFDYRLDRDGAACPFAAHVRRANPRDLGAPVKPPRIARRGMSFGQRPPPGSGGDSYGVMFMAYNASIAEQFEVVQRWLAGGNSSGVSSADSDPIMGVPEKGVRRIFRFIHEGQVVRLDLGEEPLVQLEWGLYAFAPSIDALKKLSQPEQLIPPPSPTTRDRAHEPLDSSETADINAALLHDDAWRLRLEDGRQREAAWRGVKHPGSKSAGSPLAAAGVLNTEYGLLVGSPSAVLEVLKDDGSKFSTSGYGRRMAKSIGLGFLGEDDVGSGESSGHGAPYVERVNKAIETTINEAAAYSAAYNLAQGILNQAIQGNSLSLEASSFAGKIVGALCAQWFGIPDAKATIEPGARSDNPDAPPRCPGHLLAVSRYVFSPHTTETVANVATEQGRSFSTAVETLLKGSSAVKAAPLTAAILAAMKDQPAELGARTVAGVMLGFPATVIGNLATVIVMLTTGKDLWDWQQRLVVASGGLGAMPSFACAKDTLRDRLLQTMRKSPVPYMDWRTAACDGTLEGVQFKKGDIVVVGLGAAVQESNGDSMLMFG